MEQKKGWKFALKWVGIAFAVVILVVCSLVALLQTAVVRRQLGSWLSAALSAGPHQQVEIGKLEGLIPFRMRVDTIGVNDGQGRWLTLEDLVLHWAPLDLLKGRIRIVEISAARIDIARLPQVPEEREQQEFNPPELPEKPPPIVIEKLAVPVIRIGEPVAGKSAVFSLEGRIPAVGSGGGLPASLRIVRIDEGPPTQLDAKVTLHGLPTAAGVEVDFSEAEGGWVSSVAGLKDAGPLSLTFHGDGPLSTWSGALDWSSGEYGSMHAEIGLKWQEQVQVSVEGKVVSGDALIPPSWLPLVGQETLLRLNLRYRPSKSVTIDDASLQGKGYSARLGAEMDLLSQRIDAEFTFDINDLKVLEPVSGLPLAGKLAARGRLAGPFKEPQGTFSLELEQVRAKELHAESISTEVQLAPQGPLSPDFSGLRITGSGKAIGLTSAGEKPFPEKAVQWSLAAEVPSKGKVTLSELGVRGEHHQLNVTGDFDSIGQVGRLDAELEVNDLRPLAAYVGQEFPGTAKMQVHVTGDARAQSASGNVQCHVVPSAGSSKELAALIGPKLTITGEADLRQGDQLSVPAFQVESSAFQFKSHASMNLSNNVLNGNWRLSVPKLDPLAPVIGRPLSGKLEARGDVSGPIGALETTANLEGDSVVLNKTDLQKVTLTLEAKNVPTAPKGNIEMDLLKKDARATVSTGFSYGDRRLALSHLSAKAPGGEVEGEVTLDLKKPLVVGKVDGRLKDLAALGRFLGEKMGGGGEFHAGFSPGKEGQDVSLIVKARGVDTPFGRTSEVSLSADLRNVLGFPEGRADLEVLGFQTSGMTVTALTAKASGDKKGMSFKGAVQGRSVAKFDLSAQGSAARSNSGDELRMEKFEGDLGEYAIKLFRPATIRRSSKGLSLDGLAVGFGPGTLRASGGLDEKRVMLDVDFEKLPVGISTLLTGPALNGSADGKLQLNGEASRPSGSLDLRLSNVRSSDPSYRELPPASLDARGRLEGGLLSVEAGVQGPTQKPVRAELRVPVQFSVEPFAFSISHEGAIKGHLDAEANLAALARFVPMEGQTISGWGAANLDLSGQVAAPELNGAITVQNGTYENFETGTVLKDLELKILADNKRLEIETFRATDGGKGKISANGALSLDAAGNYPAGLDVRLSDATLVRRDDVTTAVNGDLKFSGSIKHLALKGDLTVGPAEINLPKRLPPEVRELEVVEIHGGNQKPVAREKQELKSPVAMALDLKVNLPNRVFVRGWGLDSVWSGNLRITGSTGGPVITGSLSPTRGSFEFVNRRFKIVEGNIGFFGNVPPLPYVDVTAESQAKELTARLHLLGSGSDMKITLESDPPLPSDEILAQLMFGRSTTSISATQALRLASAINALSGAGGGNLDVVERTRKLLQLDVLEYRETEGGKLGQGAVSIGKYLTEGIYMNVEKGVGQQTDKASVEVDITPHISVESEVGSNAEGGIGVNWKFDY